MIHTDSFFSRSRLWTAASLLDFTPLTAAQKEHLTKVYAALAACSLITFAGAAVPLRYLSFHPLLLLGCFLGSLLYVTFTAPRMGSYSKVALPVWWLHLSQPTDMKRMIAAGIMAFSQGLLMREVVHYMLFINPEIITTALFATIAIFTCFSVGSLLMSSRLALYLGGLAFSLSMYISLVRFTNIFVRSRFVSDFSDVAMLIAFCGFVVFDTQITLRDFNNGSRDFLTHAVMLYGDVISIFMKITKILHEKEKKKENKKSAPRPLF
ncbi:Bax inhibitor protein [Babesia ovis]|uniref:Bax inhibitor protein n=1 Tax=Babesia ovis TaxID=5869 RepID=A0A9W5TBG3_BABOV|nr:Bax inhibitor protein [Babesia ovis]